MYKLLSICILSLCLANCTNNCKYNEYLPENNPLVIPEELKPIQK